MLRRVLHTPPNPQVFHDEYPYHIETSLQICSADQWTGFCMIGISIMKGLIMILLSFNLTSNYKYISSKMSEQKNLLNSLNFPMISIISVIIIHCFISSTDISIFNAIIFTGFTINVIDIICIISLLKQLLHYMQGIF